MALWIRVDVDSPRNPRVGLLAERLGIPPRHAYGMVVAVWCAMGEHAKDGDLTGVSDATIDEWAGAGGARRGSRKTFANVFAELFLNEGRCDREFAERQGKLEETARKNRMRMAQKREKVREPDKNNSRTNDGETTNVVAIRNETERNEPQKSVWRSHGGAHRTKKGAGMKIFGEIRAKRTGVPTINGTQYRISPEILDTLDDRTKGAVVGIGGLGAIATADEEKLSILRSQFAEMYAAEDDE